MTLLPKSLTNITELIDMAKEYKTLDISQKTLFLQEAYKDMSLQKIAEICGTYTNRIKRDLKKCGIKARSKSDAQKLALESGRHEHPTKGKKRTQKTKDAIGEAISEVWKGLSADEKEYRSQIGKDQWNSMTPEEQDRLQQKAYRAVRLSAKMGSKLEKFLLGELGVRGYKVEFHAEQKLRNEKLQIDLLLPELKVAIEVDGPSHFLPIWGNKALTRNIKSDEQKNGLLLGAGFCILRVRQNKNLSEQYKREILQKVLEQLQAIEQQFPEETKRCIIVEV